MKNLLNPTFSSLPQLSMAIWVPADATMPPGRWCKALPFYRGRSRWLRRIDALSKECDRLLQQARQQA